MEIITAIPVMFYWWYTGGIKKVLHFLQAVFIFLNKVFDPIFILKTLFSPWKQLVGTKMPGIVGWKDWLVDNLISRGVGFSIRVLFLGVFLVFVVFYIIFALIVTIFWFLFPLILIISFFNIFRQP